ncbi:ATP-binding protein [Rubellimicrobium sp. CFH 75288]|uniref:ATP-binding protein n=1 Tax=Rubellimicrobium sp. CFH 75288 TaxID=2697034 RepID=UPI0014129FE0|nr:ATP-binding protein [Rubellimicrobium sp. CFH 75288]NAZ36860.1 hypothetical protein [Rubellimicrobium sp. CFH 75288]
MAGQRLRVRRHLACVAPAAMASRDFARLHLDEEGASSVELAVAETLTNAIKHGQVRGRDDTDLVLSLDVDPEWLTVEIFDHVPLVPDGLLQAAGEQALEIDPEDLVNLSESGRGLALIVLSMDEVSLHTTPDRFSLRMRKRLG